MNLDTPISQSSPAGIDPIIFQLKEKVAALQNAILSQHPTLPGILRQIHQQLRADPELVTTLDEDEIGSIVNGLKRQVQVEIVTTTPKALSAGAVAKKAIKSAGANAVDLF